MKENLGQLTLRDLILGLLICLGVGIAIFLQFTFKQKIPAQDTTITRLNDLEKKLGETQATLDQLKKNLNQVTVKMTQSGPAKPSAKKRH